MRVLNISNLKNASRYVRRLRNNFGYALRGNYPINDEFYWDEYVKNWEGSEANKQFKYLGNEWKNEEIFISLLQKYSSRTKEALEIGCGGGRITSTAARLFKRVWAADISNEMLRKCEESVNASNVGFRRLDGFTLGEFAERSLDCVYSHDVFVHFSSLQVYPYLKEIRRVLRSGGVGLLSFYNFVVHFELFKELSLKFWSERRFPPHARGHFVTEEMLRAMLSDLGLEVLEMREENFLIVVFSKS